MSDDLTFQMKKEYEKIYKKMKNKTNCKKNPVEI